MPEIVIEQIYSITVLSIINELTISLVKPTTVSKTWAKGVHLVLFLVTVASQP